jgi:hypothetical protein
MFIYHCRHVYYVIRLLCTVSLCTFSLGLNIAVVTGKRQDYHLLLVEGEVRANMVAYERQVPKDLWN